MSTRRSAAGTRQISSRNATFQIWQTLLTNRTKRHRAGEFLVQGVRPITLALDAGLEVRAVLSDGERRLSEWANAVISRTRHHGAAHYALTPELLAELGEKEEAAPEVLLVVAMPADDLARIPVGEDLLAVVLDRPSSPGNVGSIARSLDAFGGHGLIVTGHAADPYDPRAVRASTGSALTVPIVRTGSPQPILAWVEGMREQHPGVQLLGTDENGGLELADADLTAPSVLVTGNEASGLSGAWRDACDTLVRIPIGGTASSLNAANATTVVLYEAIRQRRSR